MAALFLAYVAPQTGCILALWIVLCVFVESPIGRYPTPSSFFAASPSSFCFLHLLAALLFPPSNLPSSLSFPPLSLCYPSSILPPLTGKKATGVSHNSTPRRNSARLIPWIYESSTFFHAASRRVFKVLRSNTVNVCNVR